MELLVCIAFHYAPERIVYLKKVVENFLSYPIDLKIIIDTNVTEIPELKGYKVEIHSHENLDHPFYLTWVHRWHIKANLDNYKNFMYIEDDMYIPYHNYKNYIQNYDLLKGYIPSFIRVEENKGKQYATDITEQATLKHLMSADRKIFTTLPKTYQGFWIMPQYDLHKTMLSNFVREHQSRETACSYPTWELNKKAFIEIEKRGDNWEVSELCHAYHLPNNYAQSSETHFAKIELKNIFKL